MQDHVALRLEPPKIGGSKQVEPPGVCKVPQGEHREGLLERESEFRKACRLSLKGVYYQSLDLK
jgi:hypothetical protein